MQSLQQEVAAAQQTVHSTQRALDNAQEQAQSAAQTSQREGARVRVLVDEVKELHEALQQEQLSAQEAKALLRERQAKQQELEEQCSRAAEAEKEELQKWLEAERTEKATVAAELACSKAAQGEADQLRKIALLDSYRSQAEAEDRAKQLKDFRANARSKAAGKQPIGLVAASSQRTYTQASGISLRTQKQPITPPTPFFDHSHLQAPYSHFAGVHPLGTGAPSEPPVHLLAPPPLYMPPPHQQYNWAPGPTPQWVGQQQAPATRHAGPQGEGQELHAGGPQQSYLQGPSGHSTCPPSPPPLQAVDQPGPSEPARAPPPNFQLMRHIKLPEYDGKKDALNFFAVFERACASLGVRQDDEMMGTYLLGRLKGTAQAWVQGVDGRKIAEMGYKELRQALCENFQREGMQHVRAVQRLRQGASELSKFNDDFSEKTAAALHHMTELQLKDIYVNALTNGKMRDHLSMALHLTLPQLQTKAADFQHMQETFQRSHPSHNNDTTSAINRQHQNPNRVYCTKCKWWHFKDEKCKCPGGGSTAPASRATRSTGKPRVPEA
jgi:hypothetical protein